MDNASKSPNKSLLHYGCLIYLTYKDEQGKEYYVTADGYTKNKIQLKSKEEILQQSSISASLFKIYPTFYNNEYVKTRKKYDEKRKLKKFTTIERREAQAEIPKQIKAMEEETALNYEQYEKFKGSPVIFGQTIQLLHVNSNKYLFYDLNHVSEYESNNLKVGLKDEHSDETCYRILPCYTFQQEGSGNIYDEDIVNIVSTVDQIKKIGGEPYLHASKAKQFEDKLGQPKEKREVNVSTEKKTPWKVHIFSEYIDEREGFLSVQDSVWINFSESELNLIVQKDQSTHKHKAHQIQEGEEGEAQQDQYSIKFESCTQSANYSKFVGNSNGMFTIESQSMLNGGLVRWWNEQTQSLYRLRHLTTKQYLKVQDDMNEHNEFRMETVSDYQQASLFAFELIYSTLTSYNREKAQEFLQKDSYFRLSTVLKEGDGRAADQNLWFKTSKHKSHHNNEEEEYYPAYSMVKKEEFVFKLAKANFNDVRMTNFLLACLKTIRGAEQYLSPAFLSSYTMNDERFQVRYKNFLIHVSRLEKCLQDLGLFCHNKLIAYLYIDQEYGQVNPFIQNVLREQWFIEMLVRILCVAFPNYDQLEQLKLIDALEGSADGVKNRQMLGEEQRKTKQAIQQQIKKEFFNRKKKVCSLIYKLLAGICEHNQINQEKAAMYLTVFAQHSLFINHALDCIIVIIKDFEELQMNLHKQVDDDEEQKAKLLEMGRGVKQSQTGVLKRHQPIKNIPLSDHKKKEINFDDYIKQYNKIATNIIGGQTYLKIRWDLILFFTNLLKNRDASEQKKRELISFLEQASVYRGRGVNINQERIHKYLLAQGTFDSLFEQEVLIKILAEGDIIKVFYKGEERVFLEFFTKEKKKENVANTIDQDIGQSKYLSMFLKKQAVTIPSSQVPTKTVLNLISEQIDFYSSMCNSRNNTWKRSLEPFLPGTVLINNLIDSQIGYDMRATICRLLNKLYVDQEPRRVQSYPELCKVLSKDKTSKKGADLNQSEQSEGVRDYVEDIDLEAIKQRLLQYIKELSTDTEQMSDSVELKDADSTKLEKLRVICRESPKVYNALTLEIVRLQKLLIDFGKYSIRLGSDDNDTKRINTDFFGLIQTLFVILEFDSTYPEARKILLEKRREDQRQRSMMPTKFLGNMMGTLGKGLAMFDIFGITDDPQKKDQKKKGKSSSMEAESMNMNESFLKQSNVLRKILSKFLQEGKDVDLLIKLEICDILDQYLDQKMDFCLNIFKVKFKEYVVKLQLMEKLESGELYIDQEKKIIQDHFKKIMANCIQAIIPPILRTGTIVDKTDPKLNQEEDTFGFANLANLTGGVSPEGSSKEIESIDINRILDFEIFPTLITLFCMTQSLSMETKLLNILTRFYNQRLEFAELTTKMLVLFDEVNIKVFKVLKKKIRRIAKNIDESETWMQDLKMPDNLQTLKQTTDYFAYFTKLLYAESYLDEHEEVVADQEMIVDAVRQDMMRNLDVYKLGISLIKDNIHMVDSVVDAEIKDYLKELFRNCFIFLRNFVERNITNQIVLSEYLVTFLVHIETDLGQVSLINEIFRNNKKICLEKPGMLTDDFINLIVANGRQVKYLEFFLIIQRVNKEYIQSNQKAVLNIFMDPRNKQHIFALKDRHHSSHHHESKANPQAMTVKHEFDFEPQVQLDNANYLDEPYLYHAKLLEVLYNCAIGKEGMLQNETRLRSMISLKYALEVLSAPDSFNDPPSSDISPRSKQKHEQEEQIQAQKGHAHYSRQRVTQLKIPMLQYIFYTYLESEKLSDDIFRCINDVQDYIQSETHRLEHVIASPDHPYIEYLFTYFLMNMNQLLKIYQKELREETLVHQNQQVVHQQIESLLHEVEGMRSAFRSRDWIKEVKLSEMQRLLLQFFCSEDVQKAEQDHQQQKEAEELRRKNDEAESAKRAALESKRAKKKATFMTNMLQKKNPRARPDNFVADEAWKQLWAIYLECFLNSKELKNEIEAEHFVFAKALDKVEEIFEKDPMMAEHINKNEIFKKLITFLNKGHNQAGCTPTLKQVLRALGNYIVISQDNIDKNAEDDEKENELQEWKVNHQNFLNGNNAMAIVLMLLSDYKDVERSEAIYNDLISFGIMLLDGGNRDVQKSVYNFFLNYTTSEVFFLRLHEKFDQEVIDIKQEDKDDGTIIVWGFQKQPDAIQNTLRFMQLFAEGHYSELQNYMRFQQMNYHTYDLFTDVVELLQGYLLLNKDKYFENMIQCFDTITEFVQGPCFENQIALFQANFLDMASNLLSIDEIMDEIDRNIAKRDNPNKGIDDMMLYDSGQANTRKKQHEPFPRWMFARLKYKCSITLLSLLEARKSNETVIRLIKSLNIDMLKRNIVDIFHMFQVKYKEDYSEELFLHFNQDPEGNDPDQIEYSSFIIETGFNLYVLYQIFLEVKETTEIDGKANAEEDQADTLKQFLENSILGQIMQLFLSILEGLADTMAELKNKAQDALLGKGDVEKDYDLMKEQLKERRAVLFKKAMNFFSEHSVHIEVLREDKMLEKTYFYLPPFCFSLDDESKTNFNEAANRISVKAKVTSLLQESDVLIKKMKLNYQLSLWLNKIKVLAVIVKNVGLLRDIAFLLALVINLMVLLMIKKQNDAESRNIEQIIITLGTIVIVFSMLIVAYFLAKTAPLIIKQAWVGVKKDNYNLAKLLLRFLNTFYLLLSDFYILYYLIYGFTAIIGTIWNPFFFAFHLFDVLVRFPVLLNVVKAVWMPKKAIMFTLFLWIVLMYVFSLFGYYWLYESYPANFCESTWQCLLTAVDRSFKYDGGIGGFMTPSVEVAGHEHDLNYFMVRFFFDNLYYILLMIIMINIVSGIIIDRFGTLREDLAKYTFDLDNYCFICGFDKEIIEKLSKSQKGFRDHIKKEHYMWNYLFYIAYIKNKDQTELTGIESYVADKIDDDDISFFPTFKALCMNDDSDEQEQAVLMKQLAKIKEEYPQQEQLQEMLDGINEQLEKIEEEHNII